MPRTTELAVAIRDARIRAGLNVQEAADKIGVARNTVANWESGLPPSNRPTLNAIEDAYGLDRGALAAMWQKARRTRRRPRKDATTEAA